VASGERRARRTGFICAALAAAAALHAQSTSTPTLVLTNGKVITVDERFSIAQAVAVSGERIVGVGTNDDIIRLAGPAAMRIDLGGRSVIPGLIDNHMHLVRAGITWQQEVRWDGVASRRQALSMLARRAAAAGAGAWIYSLGGWTIDQFADDSRPFTRDELDAVVPDHPVLLQASYYEAYLNSLGLQAMGIDDRAPAGGWVVRDTAGRPTGRVREAGIRGLAARLPAPSRDEVVTSTAAMIADLNRIGLTTFGSAGCDPGLLPLYRGWADRHELNVRVFCLDSIGAGTPAEVDQALPQIAALKLFQGDAYVDRVSYGESVYGPLHDPMFLRKSDPRPEHLAEWTRIATQVARAGLPLHVHAELDDTITAFLDEIERINARHPIRSLRWTLAHVNQLSARHLARMRALGLYAAVHPWAVINGGILHGVFAEGAYDMAPLATIQQSGVVWGLGSDGSRANQVRPFDTLAWAVTGRMVGGRHVLRQTIGREDALIAHTRRNAFFVFQESNLGSIQPGKLADLVVLDRDYLTVPAEEIKDITPVLTMVGGRVVFDARSAAPASQPREPGRR
jgi:predicted amidohydrolase YtcJ